MLTNAESWICQGWNVRKLGKLSKMAKSTKTLLPNWVEMYAFDVKMGHFNAISLLVDRQDKVDTTLNW